MLLFVIKIRHYSASKLQQSVEFDPEAAVMHTESWACDKKQV